LMEEHITEKKRDEMWLPTALQRWTCETSSKR
jgi:hypothetical protein